jgi:2'-5' RNA ligase
MPASGSRIFLAAPVPKEAGAQLLAWAAKHLPKQGCQLTKLNQLHVTLFFSPKTSPSGIERLKTLTQLLEWAPLEVQTSGAELLSREAFCVMLDDISPPETALTTRFRGHHDSPEVSYFPESLTALDMAFTQEIPGRYYRSRKTLKLHITLARLKGIEKELLADIPPPPSLAFDLTDAVLYNSILKAEGAQHIELARAKSL